MSTPVIGFEEDMGETGRDYGSEAMLRRLGALAKQRREELGLGRPAFAKHAGIGSDKTVYDFEVAANLPKSYTMTRMEKALGWRVGSIQEMLDDEGRRASSVLMEDLDVYDSRLRNMLDNIPTTELLAVLITRLTEIQATLGGRSPQLPTRDMLGLAASGGHKPEHLDDDPDDDLSNFNPSDN